MSRGKHSAAQSVKRASAAAIEIENLRRENVQLRRLAQEYRTRAEALPDVQAELAAAREAVRAEFAPEVERLTAMCDSMLDTMEAVRRKCERTEAVTTELRGLMAADGLPEIAYLEQGTRLAMQKHPELFVDAPDDEFAKITKGSWDGLDVARADLSPAAVKAIQRARGYR